MHVILILSNSAVNNILRISSDLKFTVLLEFVCMYINYIAICIYTVIFDFIITRFRIFDHSIKILRNAKDRRHLSRFRSWILYRLILDV